jgi:hypothetical protein
MGKEYARNTVFTCLDFEYGFRFAKNTAFATSLLEPEKALTLLKEELEIKNNK